MLGIGEARNDAVPVLHNKRADQSAGLVESKSYMHPNKWHEFSQKLAKHIHTIRIGFGGTQIGREIS